MSGHWGKEDKDDLAFFLLSDLIAHRNKQDKG